MSLDAKTRLENAQKALAEQKTARDQALGQKTNLDTQEELLKADVAKTAGTTIPGLTLETLDAAYEAAVKERDSQLDLAEAALNPPQQ